MSSNKGPGPFLPLHTPEKVAWRCQSALKYPEASAKAVLLAVALLGHEVLGRIRYRWNVEIICDIINTRHKSTPKLPSYPSGPQLY
jgi:hypothetical protein